jgi:hypothetical protein
MRSTAVLRNPTQAIELPWTRDGAIAVTSRTPQLQGDDFMAPETNFGGGRAGPRTDNNAVAKGTISGLAKIQTAVLLPTNSRFIGYISSQPVTSRSIARTAFARSYTEDFAVYLMTLLTDGIAVRQQVGWLESKESQRKYKEEIEVLS